MTAKIRLELENATSRGFDEIVKDLDRLGLAGDKTDASIEALNNELSSRKAAEQSAQIKKLADQYDEAAVSAREAAKVTKRLKDELDRQAVAAKHAAEAQQRSSARWTEFNTRVLAGIEILKQIVAIAPQIREHIQSLADSGSKDMDRLGRAIDGVGGAFSNLSQRALASKTGTSAAGWFAGLLEQDAAGIEALPALFDSLNVVFLDTMASMADSVGILSDAEKRQHDVIMRGFGEREASRRREIDDIKRATAERKSRALLDASIADVARVTEEQRDAARIRELNSVAAVREELEKERKASEDAAKAGKFTAEDAEKTKRRQLQLLQREQEIKQRNHQARMQQEQEFARATEQMEAENARRDEESYRQQLQREQDLRQVAIETERIKFQAAEERREAERRAQQAATDKLKGALGGASINAPNQQAVAQQIFDQREAAMKERQRQERLQLDARQRARRADPNVDQGANLERERRETARIRSRQRREMERAAREERRAMLTGRGGNFTEKEIGDASADLSNKAVEKLASDGSLNQTQVNAIKQLAREATTRKSENERLQAEVDEVVDRLNQALSRGPNSTNRNQRR